LDKVASFGKQVRYRFDIGNENPDPEKYDGKIIYPNTYTLDPVQWTIRDNDETREGVAKFKKIALVSGVEETEENGKTISRVRFVKIKLRATQKGILTLNLDREEDVAMCMALELHPKLSGGEFANPEQRQLITRIDEAVASKQKSEERSMKLKAMTIAQGMSHAELIDFADAMQWDSSQDESVLRNITEQLAEDDPKFFKDLVESKNLEYRSQVKRAMNKGIIGFDPGEYRFYWVGSKQPITQLQPSSTKNEVEQLADWLQIGGQQAEAMFKKIKSLNSGKEKEVAA